MSSAWHYKGRTYSGRGFGSSSRRDLWMGRSLAETGSLQGSINASHHHVGLGHTAVSHGETGMHHGFGRATKMFHRSAEMGGSMRFHSAATLGPGPVTSARRDPDDERRAARASTSPIKVPFAGSSKRDLWKARALAETGSETLGDGLLDTAGRTHGSITVGETKSKVGGAKTTTKRFAPPHGTDLDKSPGPAYYDTEFQKSGDVAFNATRLGGATHTLRQKHAPFGTSEPLPAKPMRHAEPSTLDVGLAHDMVRG